MPYLCSPQVMLSLALAVWVAPSWGQAQEQPTESTPTEYTPSIEQTIPLNVPRAEPVVLSKYYIGQFQCEIMPERFREFMSPAAGYIENWLHDSPRSTKGVIIATVNQPDIELERREIAMTQSKAQITKDEETLKLSRQIEQIEFYLNLSKDEQRFADENMKRDADIRVLQSIQDKISMMEQEFTVTCEKQNREFQKKEEAAIIRMPFDGRLQYQFSLPKDGANRVHTESGAPIATVIDDSAFYLTISISNPEITRLDGDELTLELNTGNGKVVKGDFSHKKVQKAGTSSSPKLVFYFKIDPSDHDTAHDMIGSHCLAKLYFQAIDPVEPYSKVALALLPEAKNVASWQDLIDKIKPGYDVIIVAESQILIRKKQ